MWKNTVQPFIVYTSQPAWSKTSVNSGIGWGQVRWNPDKGKIRVKVKSHFEWYLHKGWIQIGRNKIQSIFNFWSWRVKVIYSQSALDSKLLNHLGAWTVEGFKLKLLITLDDYRFNIIYIWMRHQILNSIALCLTA